MSVDFDPVQIWVLRCRLCGECTPDDTTASRVEHARWHVARRDGGTCGAHGCYGCAAGVCDDDDFHLGCGPK